MRVRIVAFDRKVFETEAKDVLDARIDAKTGKLLRRARELLFRLLDMVQIEVNVAEGMDELSRQEACDLREHHREKSVGRDIERDPEEDISAPLIELAGKPASGHVELKEAMTRRQRHFLDVPDVPSADDESPRVGRRAEHLHQVCDLIDAASIRSAPGTPLFSVDGSELPFGVRPLVPNRNLVVPEVLDVRLSPQEPKELNDDGADVQLLRREQRKAGAEIEAHLMTEATQRSDPGAVFLASSCLEQEFEEFEILAHGLIFWCLLGAGGSVIGNEFEKSASKLARRGRSATPREEVASSLAKLFAEAGPFGDFCAL